MPTALRSRRYRHLYCIYKYQSNIYLSTWDSNLVDVLSRRRKVVTLRRGTISRPVLHKWFPIAVTLHIYIETGSLILGSRITVVLNVTTRFKHRGDCSLWKGLNVEWKRGGHNGSLFPFRIYFYKQHARMWLWVHDFVILSFLYTSSQVRNTEPRCSPYDCLLGPVGRRNTTIIESYHIE